MDVNTIMKENIELLLNRDGDLQNLMGKSGKLKDVSKKYKDDAKKLKMAFYWRKYKAIAAIVGILLIFLLLKFWVF